MADVLDADVDALLDVAVADDFVEDDADGAGGHVVDYAGFAVVDFVGLSLREVLVWVGVGVVTGVLWPYHALLDCAIRYDVDDVADLVFSEVGGEFDVALLLEVPREGCYSVLASLLRILSSVSSVLE